MIRNIFIPEKIGSYYLLSKRIVGIDIGRGEIFATICFAKGYKRIIEKCIEERIDTDSNLTHEERIIKALKLLKAKLGNYDAVYAAFPSSSVIFKELVLPFIGPKKVKAIVPFEVESLLPFTLDQAVIDSIITKQDTANNKTEILVAAVKKEYIAEFVHLFESANINLDKITVDMFELYGLYKTIGQLQSGQPIALVDIGLYSTRLAVIIDNQLKYIRVLSKGLITIAKKISIDNGHDINESLKQILRFGIDTDTSPDSISVAIQQALADLLHEIGFTINSVINKLQNNTKLEKIILSGSAADMPNISNLVKSSMHVECQTLHMKNIIHNGNISSKLTKVSHGFLVSLATALAPAITQDFNLEQEYKQKQEDLIINKQIISAGCLILLLLGSFGIYSYFRIKKLRQASKNFQSEAIAALKQEFKLKEQQVPSLAEANKAAKRELQKQQETWRQLLSENRYSLLNALSELTRCVNKKNTQLQVSQLTIENNKIELYGEVPNHDALTKLQNALTCPSFEKIAKLQATDFRNTPIILYLKEKQL